MILYAGNLNDSTHKKMIGLINIFGKFTEHKTDIYTQREKIYISRHFK